MNRECIERNQIPIYFVAVIAAVVGGLSVPSSAQSLHRWVTPAIAVLMYAMFLQIPFHDLRKGFGSGNKRFMLALLSVNFVLVPMLVWALTRSIADHPAILIGALLVLLTPCIDYVVVFVHIGKGDARAMLAATPILLLLQLVLLPLYLIAMLGPQSGVVVAIGPFIEAFLILIVTPLILAVVTSAWASMSKVMAAWNSACAWAPVPAMAIVLVTVVASQIAAIVRDIDQLLPVVPVYGMFVLLAPIAGAAVARMFKLKSIPARAVTFSAATRNSLVVLPLALALPEDVRGLAGAAVITQTLIELVAQLIYVRVIPACIWRGAHRARRNAPR